jgi:hypothetical protein
LDEPETKSNFANKPQTGKDQYSAPRSPVENAKAHYRKKLPSYRVSWDVGDYQPLYLRDMLKRMRSQWPERTLSDAVSRLENAERDGKFGFIETDLAEFLERNAELNRQAAETIASHQESAAQPEPPREPLEDAIARLMAGLTPAAVLAEVTPKHRAVFARLPSNPEEAWGCLTIAQKSVIRVHLEKKYVNKTS